jgi:hypothetical protein
MQNMTARPLGWSWSGVESAFRLASRQPEAGAGCQAHEGDDGPASRNPASMPSVGKPMHRGRGGALAQGSGAGPVGAGGVSGMRRCPGVGGRGSSPPSSPRSVRPTGSSSSTTGIRPRGSYAVTAPSTSRSRSHTPSPWAWAPTGARGPRSIGWSSPRASNSSWGRRARTWSGTRRFPHDDVALLLLRHRGHGEGKTVPIR